MNHKMTDYESTYTLSKIWRCIIQSPKESYNRFI